MNQIIATTMKALTLDQSQCFHSSGQIAEKPNVYGWSDQPQTLRPQFPPCGASLHQNREEIIRVKVCAEKG